MSKKYTEYKKLDLSAISKEILEKWRKENTFKKSIEEREGKPEFVFYEGPPSANGLPGIHHVMARAIKDMFCRYQTLKGFQVKRKAGWDTHGLPIELGVEKALGITKEDIGKKITVEQYNLECRKDVMKYTDKWEDLTEKMGYWVDMKHPYITYDNRYIESVWWLLKNLFDKGSIYKGYTIQPYSPAAGTGLSTHELNQPGCYRNVKDRTAVAMFRLSPSLSKGEGSKVLSFGEDLGEVFFLAWTTTPWTLPSNTALAVGKNITYSVVKTFSPFTHQLINVILAKDLLGNYFSEKNKELKFEDYKPGDKSIPFEIISEFKGSELEGMRYEQLLPFSKPTDGEDAFRVVLGDFVTTEDGTGIVHIAPSFGADDFRVAKQNGIGSLTLVDKRGKFLPEVKDDIFLYGNEFVKEAYLSDEEKEKEFQHQKKILESNGKIKELKNYLSVDERIVLKLQEEGKLFKKETYEHSYPHCWRTDKPVLYYPLDSWFIRTTAYKERMIELNKTINWKPESTGTGRFGNWLENLNDWNLSRSRFWGIPIPIWTSKDRTEQICIGSAEDLKKEIENAVKTGVMKNNPLGSFTPGDNSTENYNTFDLHKPYADEIVLEKNGKKLFREPDLIDVWFDSGSMPYAQWHYPFENKEQFEKSFPADFIAEGVDQTRGWFFTLHAIAAMVFDSVAYKNVISNGLVLDKNGNKMSKRLGNAADPFETLEKYGADATRWYMITNAQPWDNLKFDIEGIAEVQRKFFGTLYNTYSFFALYANIDHFVIDEQNVVPVAQRTELDRWIISKLHSLVEEVTKSMDKYEPTPAARAIENFVGEHLSNWYVRLSRRRFWKGEMSEDKKAAYETLYECLNVTAQLMSPFAPFFADWLYGNLTEGIRSEAKSNKTPLAPGSVHLTILTKPGKEIINKDLEGKMEIAQNISSMVLSLRKKQKIRVRQPLNKIMVPVLNKDFKEKLEAIKNLILSEVNVKEIEYLEADSDILVKKIKANFKALGPKYGKQMKAIAAAVAEFSQADIAALERSGTYELEIEGEKITLTTEDVEISSQDIPGWLVAFDKGLTVALDITLTEQLKEEGIARELVNRIQNLRKDKDFQVTDRINLKIQRNNAINSAVKNNLNYICAETLASSLELVDNLSSAEGTMVDVDEQIQTLITINKLN
jgi:isoleucyl-tRNA synthetase